MGLPVKMSLSSAQHVPKPSPRGLHPIAQQVRTVSIAATTLSLGCLRHEVCVNDYANHMSRIHPWCMRVKSFF